MSKATRWMMAAAVAGTATLGTAYAHLIPGVHSTPSSTTSGSGTSATQGGLRSPGQAPGATSQAPQTQSGAS
ncbi:hypothetical protein ABT154_08935 [Streptomyces sp. NPDC001728]|uniref:hypothetical protein n=1 Tax=Streptomyces sp. NPDC001728 TaxID=3154396 RepID=UPI00332797FC